MKFKSLKTAWKVYAGVAIGLVLGIADAVGYHVPKFVKWLLCSLGGAAMTDKVEIETAEAAKTVLDAVTEHDGAPAAVPPAEVAAAKAGVAAQAAREEADAKNVQAAIAKVAEAPPASHDEAIARLRNHTA